MGHESVCGEKPAHLRCVGKSFQVLIFESLLFALSWGGRPRRLVGWIVVAFGGLVGVIAVAVGVDELLG